MTDPEPATPDAAAPPGPQLARAVERLVNRVAPWTPARWAAPVRSPADTTPAGHPPAGGAPVSRAAAAHALVQRLADLGAGVEGRPLHPVPRLDSDLALPDQLTVVTVDLLAADAPAPVLTEALAAVRACPLDH